MGKNKERKFNPKPVIEYPPVPTRKWIPPDLRPKKKRKAPQWTYVKPPGINQKLKVSLLGKIWHNFRILGGNRIFLLGHFSETHKRFCYLSNGYQSPCSCLIAILYSKLTEMSKWAKETIDSILIHGDQLYFLTQKLYEGQNKTYLQMSEVLTTFYYGLTKVTMETRGETYHGLLFEDFLNAPFLINVIQDFFNDKHTTGILATQQKHFAFWLTGKYYYLFDPSAHNDQAFPWRGYHGLGFAMVMRFNDVIALVAGIHENVDKRTNSKFVITPCTIAKLVPITAKAPSGNDILKTHCALPKVEITKFEPAPPDELPSVPHVEDKIEEEQEMIVINLEDEEAEPEVDPTLELEEFSPDVALTPSLMEGTGIPELEDTARIEVPKSKIPIEHPKAESITYFTTVVFDKMGILRASTHQADPRFSRYKGEQSIANAVAAIAMLRIHKSRQWIHDIVDRILMAGEKIHADTLKALPSGEKPKAGNVCKQITVAEHNFSPDIDEYTTIGKLQSLDDEVLDLLPALQQFYRNNDACIVTGPLTLAVWYEDGFYYMFDPNERNELGAVIPKSVQVGSDIKVLESAPGFACVTWFRKLKDLIKLYMYNVEKAARRDIFILSRVQINDVPAVYEPWHNFQGIAEGKWILRGTFNQNDRRFDKENRNKQGTAMSVIALVYTQLKHIRNFDIIDVDELVRQGDVLYTITVEDLKEKELFSDPNLRPNEILRKFTLEGKQIRLDIEDCMYNGLLDAQDDNDALNLKKALQEFFVDNDTCVVTTRSISVAVWRTDGVFYYYDSHSRDENGIKNNFGLACVIRSLTLDEIVRSIEVNLPPGADNTFNISRFTIAVLELSDTGIVRAPLNNYVQINPDIAIIRSVMSERSPEFKLNKGRQTVPMCLVAAGMTKVYPCHIWSKDILTQILYIGDELFTTTMVEREKNLELPEEDDIDEVYAENCKMEYYIGFNKINIEYGDIQEGNFEDDFIPAITDFFNNINETEPADLLIASDLYTVFVWRNAAFYYLFDPRPRDETGQVYGKCDWSVIPDEVQLEEGEGEGEGGLSYPDQYPVEFGGGDSFVKSAGEDDTQSGRRHSIGYWRTVEEGGKACAMLFLTLDHLIKHVIENVPPTKRSEIKFKVFPLNVTNKTDLSHVFDPTVPGLRPDQYAGDWFDFKEIDHGRWILRGTFNYTHEMFPSHNRGCQTIAMCFAALAYVVRFSLTKFKAATVNDILKYGDRLHSATRKILFNQLSKGAKERGLTEGDINEILDKTVYDVDEVAKKFCIGLDQMQVDATTNVLEGDILAESTEEVYDVKRGLRKFFDGNKLGIITSKGVSAAVWRGANVYYMFDPTSTGPNGVICINGDACITRYLDIQVMADVFVKNVPKEGKNVFNIHKVTVKIVPCPREPKPEEKEPVDEPHYHGYAAVMPGKALLRGEINQEDPRFGRGRNVQSAPIALIALTMSLVHKASIWTRPIIDDIIVLGDELYTATLDTLGFEFNPWEQGMTLHLVNKDYKIGALRANCELRSTDQRGIIDIKHPNVLNLRQGIERFFEENTHGVIETETYTVAIWEEEDEKLIYLFDPNPRGPAGLPQTGGGACVVTFETAKIVADHIISLLDKSKRTGDFVITPVEIVVGNVRTKPKKTKDPCAKKEMQESDLVKRHPPPCEKKRLRKLAEEKRRKKEMERLDSLGRDKYHDLSNGDALIRGTKSQRCACYSEASRGNQDIPNCFAAFVLHRIIPVSDWHHKHIDMALDIGDQLYKDSFVTYEPDDPKLGFENILRKIFIKDVRVTIRVYRPQITAVLNDINLEMALLNFFQQEHFGILSAKDQHVAVFFKSGVYYMFDPHDRNVEGNKCENGCACVLRFLTLPNLAQKFISNVVSEFDSMGTFTVTLLTIADIHRIVPEYVSTKCICK